MREPTLAARLGAESLGTFVLVFGGCGSGGAGRRSFSGGDGVQLGIGFLGVSLAFGLPCWPARTPLGTFQAAISTRP